MCVKRLTELFDLPAGAFAWILAVLSPRIYSCAQMATTADGEPGFRDQTMLRPDSIRPLGAHACFAHCFGLKTSRGAKGPSLVQRS